ncbi:hypothetical protein [Trinickia terrae]|nr:hypothetical protein [Trinickia terrae]
MTESSNGGQSSPNVTSEPSDKAANAAGTLIEDAWSEQDAIASRSASSDVPQPTFLDDDGPDLDVPLFITKANARELFGLRPGETVAQALARKDEEY